MNQSSNDRPYLENAYKVIRESFFEVQSGTYIYAKVRGVAAATEHFFVSRDNDEITVVTKKEAVPDLDLVERNKDDYALIAMLVSVPFYSVGFLAVLSDALAGNDMNILIVSTYSKDYIMVREDLLDKTIGVLRGMGFQEKNPG